ncbi:MAG TPA: NAD(P)-dependent oxidoreductase [Acidimicrobiales bacterium]|nr:NAD(P)-dependent oxidoreductase [Acidimicrobiales bacterium]
MTSPDPEDASAGVPSSTPASAAVVTGASGWLGQNLVRTLAHQRDRVRCLVPVEDHAAPLSLVSPSVEVVVGDVRDPATVDRLFEGVDADAAVFHAAAVIHPSSSTREFFDVNVGGTQNMVDRARRSGAARFVHVSSNSPFGVNATPDDVFTEDSPYNPYLGYGQSKYEAEQLVQKAYERGDLATVMIRAPWFYGPYQPSRQSQFFRTIRRGRFPLVGDGTQRRSMAYTDNLVQGLLRAEVADKAPGNAYWVADEKPYELREILATVRRALAAEGLATSGPERVSLPRIASRFAEKADEVLQGRGRYVQPLHVLGELNHTIACDITRAREELGYAPTVALEEGMRASIRWCLDHGEQL